MQKHKKAKKIKATGNLCLEMMLQGELSDKVVLQPEKCTLI